MRYRNDPLHSDVQPSAVVPPKKSRFSSVSDDDIALIQNSRCAKKTQEATQWGVRTLKSKFMIRTCFP